MNQIEQFLSDNPELIDNFIKDNGELIQAIKDRFKQFTGAGDVAARFLLSSALLEVLQVELEASKDQLRDTILERTGCYVMDPGVDRTC
jgi:hypothetical protein